MGGVFFFVFGLIRYNKTLLGDNMGRFPAPLLMNTFHFTMQAVLSTAITWYWSDRFRPNVAMSWKDYFIRGSSSLLRFCFPISYLKLVSKLELIIVGFVVF